MGYYAHPKVRHAFRSSTIFPYWVWTSTVTIALIPHFCIIIATCIWLSLVPYSVNKCCTLFWISAFRVASRPFAMNSSAGSIPEGPKRRFHTWSFIMFPDQECPRLEPSTKYWFGPVTSSRPGYVTHFKYDLDDLKISTSLLRHSLEDRPWSMHDHSRIEELFLSSP